MIFGKHGCLWVAAFLICTTPIEEGFAQSVNVQAVEIKPQQLYQFVPLSGTVYSPQVTGLSAQVEGWITEVLIDTGDYVEKGDPLIRLDGVQAALSLERAQARLYEAELLMQLKQQEWEDAEALKNSKNISLSEVRERRASFEATAVQWRVAKVSLEQAHVDLQRHVIHAPFSGTVSDRFHSIGEWIRPGMALVEILQNERLKVDFQVPQRFYSQIVDDTSLVLFLDAYPNRELSARVSAKVPKTIPGSRTFLLRSELSDSEIELFPGMALSGQLVLPIPQVLAVPRDALIRYPDGRVTVWAAEFPGWGSVARVRERKVSLGVSSGDWVEVKDGIGTSSVVITVGNESLREGQDVLISRDERVRVVR
jgi:membrane fusion protein (multidrug efflux system)